MQGAESPEDGQGALERLQIQACESSAAPSLLLADSKELGENEWHLIYDSRCWNGACGLHSYQGELALAGLQILFPAFCILRSLLHNDQTWTDPTGPGSFVDPLGSA